MRKILVTGANRGIGLAITKQLSAAGHHVIATSRSSSAAPPGGSWHALDVVDEASVTSLARWVAAEHGNIDALINNAGIALDGFDEAIARATIDTNLLGPMRVTDALLPLMAADARIVMVSSGMGDRSSLSKPLRQRFAAPMSRQTLLHTMQTFVDDVAAGRHTAAGWPSSAYSVSKIGLNVLTEVYATELATDPRHIRCNAACPGWVRTDMGGRGASRSPEEGAKTPLWLALSVTGSGGLYRDQALVAW